MPSGISLLFEPGTRPDAQAVAHALDGGGTAAVSARISYQPQPAEGWLELLASGLTFDLSGLAPAAAAPPPHIAHRFGLPAEEDLAKLEVVSLIPGPHVAGGAGLAPVVRTLAGLGANLVLSLPVKAVCWGPAATAMEPAYFARMMLNWLGGGAFPALGMTALVAHPDGSIASKGLAHFTGQEVQVESRSGETQADTAKVAIRVIDYLVRHGRLHEAHELDTSDERLIAEPSQIGSLIRVWRSG